MNNGKRPCVSLIGCSYSSCGHEFDIYGSLPRSENLQIIVVRKWYSLYHVLHENYGVMGHSGTCIKRLGSGKNVFVGVIVVAYYDA